MSDGWDHGTAYGYNDVADDASMGWARYAHSMRIFVFNSGLFYIRRVSPGWQSCAGRAVRALRTCAIGSATSRLCPPPLV